jgi:hypothetical protein
VEEGKADPGSTLTMLVEPLVIYEILGIKVVSEIVRDQEMTNLDGILCRCILIKNSCESRRWGTRVQNHSYTGRADMPNLQKSFSDVRYDAAKVVAQQELGITPEEPGFGGLMTIATGPSGKRYNLLASVDLSISATRLWPWTVEALQLVSTGECHMERSLEGNSVAVPLFFGKIIFDEYEIETHILPTDMGMPCVLGGDFFQKALAKKPYLLHELLTRDHFRTLANVARCKKNHVLIIGKYGENRPRLEKIRGVLKEFGFVGLIVDDLPDIEEQSLAEKVVTFASIARFVICDDIAASGHINELDICSERRFTTAILRRGGKGATLMQADIADDVSFMRAIDYQNDEDLEDAVRKGVLWAQETVVTRAQNFNRRYQWRSGQNVLR